MKADFYGFKRLEPSNIISLKEFEIQYFI